MYRCRELTPISEQKQEAKEKVLAHLTLCGCHQFFFFHFFCYSFLLFVDFFRYCNHALNAPDPVCTTYVFGTQHTGWLTHAVLAYVVLFRVGAAILAFFGSQPLRNRWMCSTNLAKHCQTLSRSSARQRRCWAAVPLWAPRRCLWWCCWFLCARALRCNVRANSSLCARVVSKYSARSSCTQHTPCFAISFESFAVDFRMS